jgi:hypothetical protein
MNVPYKKLMNPRFPQPQILLHHPFQLVHGSGHICFFRNVDS